MAQQAQDGSTGAPPDPGELRTVDEVTSYLRQLRAWAGHVSYPELVRRVNRHREPRDHAGQTTVYDCFRHGRKRLDVELVLDIATALGLDQPRCATLRHAVEAVQWQVDGLGTGQLHPYIPRQLPATPQAFTGRVDELADIDRTYDGSALVITAIDGMAGIGKTALAVHAAHRLAGQYPDGQLFIDLHGFAESVAPTQPGDALDYLLRALAVPSDQIPTDLDERAALYRSRLAGLKVLIVLDNAATEAQVTPLLPGEPGCLVLITSRRRLAGLDHTHTLSLDTLSLTDAITLFPRTAGEKRLTDESSELVAETVELCGRLPLAIRIAAARLRSHPSWRVSHLVERLRDHRHRLAELRAGQRSVTAALELSYQQLQPDQQRAYRLLGLHPGTDTEPYTTAAILDTSLPQARCLLDQLLEDHLLQEPAPGRYRFHDLIRAHATHTTETVDAEPDRRAAITRLLDHYRHTASMAMDTAHPYERERRPGIPPTGTPTPDLSDPTRANAWLDTELPNLIAAAQHAAGSGWPEHIRQLSVILDRHLRTRGHYRDAEALHDRALTTARATGNQTSQLEALTGLGHVHLRQGRHEQAIDHYEQVQEIARATGHRAGELEALLGLGTIYARQGPHEQAIDDYEQALEIARATGHRAGELDALRGLGNIDVLRGRYEPAIDHYTQVLEIARKTGYRIGELNAVGGLGDIHWRLGQYEPAADHFRQVLEIARASGSRVSEQNGLICLGRIHLRQGRHEQAIDHYERAWDMARTTGEHAGALNALTGLGEVYRSQGRHEQAADRYRQVLDLARETGDRSGQFEALHGLGRCYHAIGRPEMALVHHRQAFELATDLGHPDDLARIHDGLAHVHMARNQPEQARQHWQHALEVLTGLGTGHTDDEEANVPAIRAHLADLDQRPEPPTSAAP